MNGRKALKFIGLLLVLYVLTAALVHTVGHHYFTVLLQGVKLEINAFSDVYSVNEIRAEYETQLHYVFSHTKRKTPFTSGEGEIYPSAEFTSRVVVDTFYVYHLLIIPLVLAWPYGDMRRRLAGLGLGLAGAAAATLAETPFMLFVEWEGKLFGLMDGSFFADPVFQYFNTLGGRQLVSVLLAALAIFLACRLVPRRN